MTSCCSGTPISAAGVIPLLSGITIVPAAAPLLTRDCGAPVGSMTPLMPLVVTTSTSRRSSAARARVMANCCSTWLEPWYIALLLCTTMIWASLAGQVVHDVVEGDIEADQDTELRRPAVPQRGREDAGPGAGHGLCSDVAQLRDQGQEKVAKRNPLAKRHE